MGKQNSSTSNGSLPAGFVNVNTGGDFPPAWTPQNKGDELRGVVTAKRSIDAKKAGRKKAKRGDQVMIINVADNDGVLHSVWESHQLADVMKAVNIGDELYLRFDGVKKLGKKTLKLFTAGVLPGKKSRK